MIWFPDQHQVGIGKSTNYFNSLFVGLTFMIVNLPMIIFRMMLIPLFFALVSIAMNLVFGTFNIIVMFALFAYCGVRGRVVTFDKKAV